MKELTYMIIPTLWLMMQRVQAVKETQLQYKANNTETAKNQTY